MGSWHACTYTPSPPPPLPQVREILRNVTDAQYREMMAALIKHRDGERRRPHGEEEGRRGEEKGVGGRGGEGPLEAWKGAPRLRRSSPKSSPSAPTPSPRPLAPHAQPSIGTPMPAGGLLTTRSRRCAGGTTTSKPGTCRKRSQAQRARCGKGKQHSRRDARPAARLLLFAEHRVL